MATDGERLDGCSRAGIEQPCEGRWGHGGGTVALYFIGTGGDPDRTCRVYGVHWPPVPMGYRGRVPYRGRGEAMDLSLPYSNPIFVGGRVEGSGCPYPPSFPIVVKDPELPQSTQPEYHGKAQEAMPLPTGRLTVPTQTIAKSSGGISHPIRTAQRLQENEVCRWPTKKTARCHFGGRSARTEQMSTPREP